VKKSKIYTRTGDKGETSLVSGTRTIKSDLRIDMYGEVDELNSRLGWAISLMIGKADYQRTVERLESIQGSLFDLGSNLACEEIKRVEWKLPQVEDKVIAMLEAEIDEMDDMLSPLKNFILPGGDQRAAAIHLCRTCARAVERRMVDFFHETGEELPINGLVFINRLSDYFFTLARWINHVEGVSETAWKPS
jgi:cob(I)alamin adenosyltransferase